MLRIVRLVSFCLVLGWGVSSIAQTAPGLKVTAYGTNQVQITITNGVTGVSYELFRTPVLGATTVYPWALHASGTLNQTNFLVSMSIELTGFFQATIGNNWDGDGAVNAVDGQPSNAAVGALTITIDSPTQGQNLQ